jgi:hypothetical protein
MISSIVNWICWFCIGIGNLILFIKLIYRDCFFAKLYIRILSTP